MSSIDQRGMLYLGQEYDQKEGKVTDSPLLFDARHLTTHGIILGMTGSGKTGLGIILLEEALLQGIPVLILDPKGDIANLLLTFPELRPEDFAPWVDFEGARRRGMTVEEYAAQEAHKWRDGLAGSGIFPERIRRLRQKAEFTIFTPGSRTGHSVDMLHSFETPTVDWDEHEEGLRERIGGITSALLGLVGIEADPLQSPEHILIARIVEHVWRAGEQLDIPTLIRLLQNPPFQQVGVFEVDTFYPEKDRFSLARTLNNLIAAPGFETWREGMPLDVGRLLYSDDGRPRASVFYLAHLNDAQRMFFVTLFLEAARDWLRAQSGTTDLRALIYFDEVYGHFPPYPRNPPTKSPLMALIKQGRAAGLGVVLATQNPADLDYKGLTNAGAWAIGSLRAERDKDRVLEGLEGAISEAGEAMDRRTIDRALSALKPRVFLFHDIREGPPVFFHTRWAMSYLRGPLTRKQIRELKSASPDPRPGDVDAPETGARPAIEAPPQEPQAETLPVGLTESPTTISPDVPQAFLPPTVTIEKALVDYERDTKRSVAVRSQHLVYTPHLLAIGTVRMLDRKRDVDHEEQVTRLVWIREGATGLDWDEGEVRVSEDDLSMRAVGEGFYAAVPSSLASSRSLKRWSSDYADYLYHDISVSIWHNTALDLYGKVGESRRDYRVRAEKEVHRKRDAELKTARARMDKRIDAVEKRKRREQRELAVDEDDLSARKREEVLSIGESAFNLLTGRRSSALVSRASRKRRMTRQAKADVEESESALEDFNQQLEDLESEWEDQKAEISERWAATLEKVDEYEVTPRRADVSVEFCGLAWVPSWRVAVGDGGVVDLPAREDAVE